METPVAIAFTCSVILNVITAGTLAYTLWVAPVAIQDKARVIFNLGWDRGYAAGMLDAEEILIESTTAVMGVSR